MLNRLEQIADEMGIDFSELNDIPEETPEEVIICE